MHKNCKKAVRGRIESMQQSLLLILTLFLHKTVAYGINLFPC